MENPGKFRDKKVPVNQLTINIQLTNSTRLFHLTFLDSHFWRKAFHMKIIQYNFIISHLNGFRICHDCTCWVTRIDQWLEIRVFMMLGAKNCSWQMSWPSVSSIPPADFSVSRFKFRYNIFIPHYINKARTVQILYLLAQKIIWIIVLKIRDNFFLICFWPTFE